ncbi:major facilitator superfamily transporter [Plectosphaerella cucumerina]|uniref:Major facilitator superfamily transporter n=1 Tax=Plectosphaerella cucumerina TaxID=40658 RepID=A0A8K0X4J4_9PEZI|nr:major facilitator superfamily transporter [Plectosphaerella cucumerina]
MGRPGPRAGRPAALAAARTTSTGSFHAGEPMPTISNIEASRQAMLLRRQSSHRYHTFPTPPPKTPRDARPDPLGPDDDDDDSLSDASDGGHHQTPLPLRQLGLLALLSLTEQTALNSISPYLPQMVESFDSVPTNHAGLYVGILASSFALAQLSTNLLWGYLSDIVGRKPTMVLGTFLLMCCFVAFGFCQTYWQIIVVHVAMGMLNGNAAVVPTVLGEVTDRTNQSKAFTWLPVVYSLGGITGPALGGLLVGKFSDHFPYLAPNIVSAALLGISVIVVGIWFEETLEHMEDIHHADYVPAWLRRVWSWVWRPKTPKRNSWSSRWPRAGSRPASPHLDDDDDEEGEDLETSELLRSDSQAVEDGKDDEEITTWREILNRNTILVLLTYLVFQLSNISFNGLYPIFANADPPAGRGLSPGIIGISLSMAGVGTIIFQAFLFQTLKTKLGNLGTYRIALLGLAVSMILMPFVGYKDSKPLFGYGTGKIWLYAELAIVLIIKNICAVGGLSSVMLLV